MSKTTMGRLTAAAGMVMALAVLAPATALAGEHDGHLYGQIETRSGQTYTGVLRWDGEEGFWDDLFNAGKRDRPYENELSSDQKRDREGIEIFGIRIGYRGWSDEGRQLVARFGDIQEIRDVRGDRAELVMKGGERLEIDGGSNDVGADITVYDPALGEIEIGWNRIERITFLETPGSVEPEGYRLWGKLRTETGEFEGAIQWDGDECWSTDELDGETRDGDVSIKFSQILAIEKNDRNGAWVELVDGRRILVEDTNDVDDSTYGIFVEDARFGRVLVSWEAFDRVDFERGKGSGKGYGEYPPLGPIQGRVTTVDGTTHHGAIVFDLDESRRWELLNGDKDDVEYYIPFAMIASIEPRSRDSSVVRLRNGEEVRLEDSTDVGEDNDGVLVLRPEGPEGKVYVRWRDVETIELD